jgi:exosome complex exonuclease RRP6
MTSLPPSIDMNTLVETLQSQALECFVAADDFPQDIAFHRSLDRQFRKDLDKTSARLLKFANRLIAYTETHSPTSIAKGAQRNGRIRRLQDAEDIADKYHSIIVDAMDSLLEHAVCAMHIP